MGCGIGKTSKETIVESSVPSTLRGRPKPEPVIDAGNKLAPEVREGLARILKRFGAIDANSKPQGRKSRPKENPASYPEPPPVAEDPNPESSKPVPSTDIAKQPASVPKPTDVPATSDNQIEEKLAVKQPTSNLDRVQKEVSIRDERKEDAEDLAPEPKQAFGGGNEIAEEDRYSPEPPRPDHDSDEEAQPYEDETLRLTRLEMERQAREAAALKAAEERLALDEQAKAHLGKITSMEGEAKDILSKYQ